MFVQDVRKRMKNFKVNEKEEKRFAALRVNAQLGADWSYVCRQALELLYRLGQADGSAGQLVRVEGEALEVAAQAVATWRATKRARQELAEKIAREGAPPAKAPAKRKTKELPSGNVQLEGQAGGVVCLTTAIETDPGKRPLYQLRDAELIAWAAQNNQSGEWAAALVELVNRLFPGRKKAIADSVKKLKRAAAPSANSKPRQEAKKRDARK